MPTLHKFKVISTIDKHRDFVDAFAYQIAAYEAETLNRYYLVCVKNKPRYMPLFIYNYLVKIIVHVAIFKK